MGPINQDLLYNLADIESIRIDALASHGIMMGVVAHLPPAEQIPAFENILHFTQRQLHTYACEYDQAVRRITATDIPEIGDAEVQLTQAVTEAKNLQGAWDQIMADNALGRVHHAELRSDFKSSMDKGIARTLELFDERKELKGRLQELITNNKQAIMDRTLTGMVARRECDISRLLEQQVKIIEKELGISETMTKDARIEIPKRLLDGMKGQQFRANVDKFLDVYKDHLPICRHFISRSMHDLPTGCSRHHWTEDTQA